MTALDGKEKQTTISLVLLAPFSHCSSRHPPSLHTHHGWRMWPRDYASSKRKATAKTRERLVWAARPRILLLEHGNGACLPPIASRFHTQTHTHTDSAAAVVSEWKERKRERTNESASESETVEATTHTNLARNAPFSSLPLLSLWISL